MILRGDLIADAEEILIQSSSLVELKTALDEFDNLKGEDGLSTNRRKCEILKYRGPQHEKESFEGIKISSQIKY